MKCAQFMALFVLLNGCIGCGLALAQTTSAQPTLLSAWLALPNLDTVAWPYAFVQANHTQERQNAQRSSVLHEIQQLQWRMRAHGDPTRANTLMQWQKALQQTNTYRLPGNWSPAWLLAHPYKQPPLQRIAAIGFCAPPSAISVWSKAGITRIRWQPGLRLSQVLEKVPALTGGQTGEVAIVWPQGNIDHYGVQAWNAADTGLRPGVRIVGTLGLKGGVFPWLRDAIAGLLAHTPSGIHCQHIDLDTQ